MKRKILIAVLVILSVLVMGGCSSKDNESSTKANAEEERYLDQSLFGNWILSDDGYQGNESFIYLMMGFTENGEFFMDTKPVGSTESSFFEGTANVDKDGYLYVKYDGTEELMYGYKFQGEFLILNYSADKYVKLKKSSSAKTATTTTQTAAPTPVSIDLSAGKYTVGTDVPPGKYDITAISGTGNFFGRPSIVSEMMGVDNNHYIPSYKNATFKNGDEIEVAGDLVVNLTSK